MIHPSNGSSSVRIRSGSDGALKRDISIHADSKNDATISINPNDSNTTVNISSHSAKSVGPVEQTKPKIKRRKRKKALVPCAKKEEVKSVAKTTTVTAVPKKINKDRRVHISLGDKIEVTAHDGKKKVTIPLQDDISDCSSDSSEDLTKPAAFVKKNSPLNKKAAVFVPNKLLAKWKTDLISIGLGNCVDKFDRNGYNDENIFGMMTDDDLRRLDLSGGDVLKFRTKFPKDNRMNDGESISGKSLCRSDMLDCRFAARQWITNHFPHSAPWYNQ
eukprot:UN34032